MKRVFSLLLVVAMLISMVPFSTHVHAAEALQLEASNVTAHPGETITVDITLSNNTTGFGGMAFDVVFDDTVLNLTACEKDLGSNICTSSKIGRWSYKMNFQYAGIENVEGDGVLATLTFEVIAAEPCTAEIEIVPEDGTFFYYTEDYDEVDIEDVAVVNGTVTVELAPCEHESKTEVPAKSPDCENAGNNLYYTCDTCGVALKADGTETTVEAETIPALGHDHKAVVTDPDCENGGYTTYTCSRCGDSYVANETDALGHNYESAVTAPTCTEKGYTTHTCSRCGHSYVDSYVDALGHDHAAEWSADGEYHWHECHCGDKADLAAHNFVNDVCDVCGYERDHVHTMTYVEGKDATCTEDGALAYYYCDACKGKFADEAGTEAIENIVIPALGHDYQAAVTAPDCENGGYTTYTCSRCGDSYVADETPALGHDYQAAVTAPDCENGGYTTYTCSRCGDSYVADETPALGHEYESTVTAPTCTEKGYTTHTCSRCGDSYVDSYVDALGHTHSTEWSADEATHWHECHCGDKADEAAHTFVGDICSVCGYERTHVHNLTLVPAVEATCTTEGSKAYYTCSGCDGWFEDASGAVLITDKTSVVIPALGHDMIAATCDEAAHCSRCDYTEGEALGHDYKAVVTAPTCTEAGYTTHTCANCGDSYVTDETPALGHTFADGKCTVCGEKDPNYKTEDNTSANLKKLLKKLLALIKGDQDVCDHSYVSVVTDPTCTKGGYTTHTCEDCGHCYTDSYVPATGHDYENGVCTDCGAKKPTWFSWIDWFWKKLG